MPDTTDGPAMKAYLDPESGEWKTSLADAAIAELTAARDAEHEARVRAERGEWLARYERGRDCCVWNPQSAHFAEWGFTDENAPSCPHWQGGCTLPALEYESCWGRAADHFIAARYDAEHTP